MPWALPDGVSRNLMTFTQVKKAPGRWKFALSATICTAVAVLTVSSFAGLKVGLLGTTGAFIGLVAPDRPPRARIPILTGMIAFYIVAIAIGALTGGMPVLLTISLTVIAMIAVLGYNTLVADPPGAMFLILGPAIASYVGQRLPLHEIVLVCGCAAVVACVVSLLITVIRGVHPERDAVEVAQESVDAYLAAGPETSARELGALRDEAYTAVISGGIVLEDAVGREPRRKEWRRLNARLRRLHVALVRQILQRSIPQAKVAVRTMEQRRYLGRPKTQYLVRWGFSRSSLPWLAARRIGAAILLTCVIAYGLHVEQPYWAVMTTALVMSLNTDRLSLTHRAAQRLAGTIVGILLFFAVHSLHPNEYVTFVIVMLCVFLVQWTAAINYAIAAMFVTPMALLITSTSRPTANIDTLVRDRIVDTAIGAFASIVIIWLTGRRAPIMLARRQFRRGLRSLERVLVLAASGRWATDAGFEARRDLAFEQLQCAHILSLAQTDLPTQMKDWDLVERQFNEATYLVLAACWTDDPRRYLRLERMAAALQQIFADLPPINTRQIDAVALADRLRAMLRIGLSRPAR